MEQCFALQLQDIVPVITYVVNFFGLPLTFELPTATQNNSDGMATVSLFDFIYVEELRGVSVVLDSQQIHSGLSQIHQSVRSVN